MVELWRLSSLLPQVSGFGPSWAEEPTRSLVWTLNYLNDNLGLLLEVKIAVIRTDEGLYTVDIATDRARLPRDESKTNMYLLFIALLNAVLVTVTMFNIRQERKDNELVVREQKRQEEAELAAQQNEAAGGDANNAAGKGREESDSDEENKEKRSWTMFFIECCCAFAKCHCLRGASSLNLVDFAMNTLCFSSIFVKLTYFTYIGAELDIALNEDKYADFSTALFFFDSLNNIEAFQFLLIAISFVKTLVVWLPATFKLVSDLLGRFFNRQSLVILLLAVAFATVGTALLGAALGPFVRGFQDVRSMTTRAVILVEAGWFW